MAVYVLIHGVQEGISSIPGAWFLIKAVFWIGILVLLKKYFNGVSNVSERVMHSKVVMITGGTSGIGAEVVRSLAERGAQIILLTQHELSDPFLQDYITDLRVTTQNELITAEQVDLSSLHSIRVFATKWVDNAPPRRLDMIVLCANTLTPAGGKITMTEDGLESNWGINYLANFHLLSILSPALRAQPPDRDVRIIFATCSSYIGGKLPDFNPAKPAAPKPATKSKKTSKTSQDASNNNKEAIPFTPGSVYATSKLAVMIFASAFQKHLTAYKRPDKQPMNARVFIVDPGFARTPGMRRFLSFGSLWGLALYLTMWPLWWLILRSPPQAAQTFLYAAMEARFGREEGGKFLKECQEIKFLRPEVLDEGAQKMLWEASERTVEALEKEGAKRRAEMKKMEKKTEKDAAKDGASSAAATAAATGAAAPGSAAKTTSATAADSPATNKPASRKSRKA